MIKFARYIWTKDKMDLVDPRNTETPTTLCYVTQSDYEQRVREKDYLKLELERVQDKLKVCRGVIDELKSITPVEG